MANEKENNLVTHLTLSFHYSSNEPINFSEVTDLEMYPNRYLLLVSVKVGYQPNNPA